MPAPLAHRKDFALATSQFKLEQAQERLNRINKVVEDLQEEQRLYLLEFLNAQALHLEALRTYGGK